MAPRVLFSRERKSPSVRKTVFPLRQENCVALTYRVAAVATKKTVAAAKQQKGKMGVGP